MLLIVVLTWYFLGLPAFVLTAIYSSPRKTFVSLLLHPFGFIAFVLILAKISRNHGLLTALAIVPEILYEEY